MACGVVPQTIFFMSKETHRKTHCQLHTTHSLIATFGYETKNTRRSRRPDNNTYFRTSRSRSGKWGWEDGCWGTYSLYHATILLPFQPFRITLTRTGFSSFPVYPHHRSRLRLVPNIPGFLVERRLSPTLATIPSSNFNSSNSWSKKL